MSHIVIGLLWREPEALSVEQIDTLRDMFQGCEVEFFSIFATNHEEHSEICRKHCVDIVVLPDMIPIPLTAMENCVSHIAFDGEGNVRELMEINARFGRFKAGEKMGM